MSDDQKGLSCSFCGKSQEEVKKLIAGGKNSYICDQCVILCSEIINEEELEGGIGAVFTDELHHLKLYTKALTNTLSVKIKQSVF